MARHGENIRKRKDGRWEGRYKSYDEESRKVIYISIYGRSYEETKQRLTLMKNPENKGTETVSSLSDVSQNSPKLPPVNGGRFVSLAEEWLDGVKKTKKLSTYIKYRQVYESHLKNPFRDVLLSEITDTCVKERLYPKDAVLGHLSDSMLKSIYCVLNQIIKFGSGKYAMTVPSLKRPATCANKKPVKPLTRGEQSDLFVALYRGMDTFKLGVLLCLHTGLRLGELCGLKWADIDFENRILMVNRTVQRIYVEGYKTKTILLETPPKSESSRREIPLSADMITLLQNFRNGKQYVFGGDKPLEPRTMQNHFKKILDEAGIENKNFHILRHTFATNCVEGGTDVKALSEILGHSDVRITLNRYVHPSMDTKRRYMDTLCMFYGQIYGQAG